MQHMKQTLSLRRTAMSLTSHISLFAIAWILLLASCGTHNGKSFSTSTPLSNISQRSVVPSKSDGWEKHKVANGIVYWVFSGYDPISGDSQIINVADIDLNKGYKLKMAYSNGIPTTASMVHRQNNAIVTMNAGYETSSIFVKIAGKVLFNMSNHQIFKTGVKNWKNDGGICIDKNGKISICNSMCSKAGEDGKSQYGEALAEQRIFYGEKMASMDNIISSAPLLIDNFNPVGNFYVPEMTAKQMSELNYENPLRHQGVRHPRTAVALTSNNHLLMFVVDGRRSNTNGFSAKELTSFLVKHFNPQYALNFDGGGSTTLCVAGYGDPETHVVNYPTDNKKFDHTGERKVSTYLYVIK